MDAAIHFVHSSTFSTALSQSPLFSIFGPLGQLPQCTSVAVHFPVRDSKVSCHQTALIPHFFHPLLSLHPPYLHWSDWRVTCTLAFCCCWTSFAAVHSECCSYSRLILTLFSLLATSCFLVLLYPFSFSFCDIEIQRRDDHTIVITRDQETLFTLEKTLVSFPSVC